MKTCAMCGEEKEGATLCQVTPATWNGFHNWVDVCEECQASRRFKTWSKPKTTARKTKAAVAAETAAPETTEEPTGPRVQIAHRRTGALLHVVESATLAGASLTGAALSGADLPYAAMRGADLQQADLRLADLTGADLRGADLRGVNLRGADLRGADLREARLNRADLNHAIYDSQTLWPSGYDPRQGGAQRQA